MLDTGYDEQVSGVRGQKTEDRGPEDRGQRTEDGSRTRRRPVGRDYGAAKDTEGRKEDRI